MESKTYGTITVSKDGIKWGSYPLKAVESEDKIHYGYYDAEGVWHETKTVEVKPIAACLNKESGPEAW